MRRRRRSACWKLCALVLLLLALGAGTRSGLRAQYPVSGASSQLYGVPEENPSPDVPNPLFTQRMQLKGQRTRFQLMVADADRIQLLATQLVAERNQHPGPYNAAQLRIVQEIEKLAHRIKENMRYEGPAARQHANPILYPADVR